MRVTNVSDRAALEKFLKSLDPPKIGRVRVFRGQVHHHTTLIPSALRHPENLDIRRFRAYCTLLASELRETYGEDFQDLESWLIWTVALAQHYSLGSPYLDVTKDIDVALWFATHQAEAHTAQLLLGPPGPFNPAIDFPMTLDITSFVGSSGSTGHLYVLDIPVWDGTGHPSHGELIDISQAPKVFSSSRRMDAQAGCLIYAKREIGGGDLSPLVACPPIAIPTPIPGRCSTLHTADLFPSAQDDHWYEALVSIPVSFDVENGLHLEPRFSVPITLYSEPGEIEHLTKLITLLPGALLGAFIRRERDQGADWVAPEAFPREAIDLLLNDPLFMMTPPLGDWWNEAVIMAGLPTTARVSNPTAGEAKVLSTERVLVEFSPLEYVFWRGLESAEQTRTIRRGLYVERKGDDFRVWDFTQQVPEGSITCAGPLLFRFNPQHRRFVLPDGTSPAITFPLIFKNFLLVLNAIRELADAPIPRPTPTLTSDGTTYLVGLQGGRGLLRTETPAAPFPIYLLSLQDDQGADRYGGMLTLVNIGSWSQVDPGELLAAVEKAHSPGT